VDSFAKFVQGLAWKRFGEIKNIKIFQIQMYSLVRRALWELRESVPEEWLWVLYEIKNWLAELPPEGSRRLFDLWK
jgi:hypothetical protein